MSSIVPIERHQGVINEVEDLTVNFHEANPDRNRHRRRCDPSGSIGFTDVRNQGRRAPPAKHGTGGDGQVAVYLFLGLMVGLQLWPVPSFSQGR